MKLKNAFVLAAIVLFGSTAFATQTLQSTGQLKWTGYKVKNIGDSHTGDLAVRTGTVQVDGDKIVGGSFTIDMKTLTYENKKLEGHLKSPDFFDVAKYPTSQFVIKKSEKLEKVGPNGETHRIFGDLTIRGKTNPFDFLAVVKSDKNQWTAEAKTAIADRSKFDINYNSPAIFGLAKLADKAIADEIKIELRLVATPVAMKK